MPGLAWKHELADIFAEGLKTQGLSQLTLFALGPQNKSGPEKARTTFEPKV